MHSFFCTVHYGQLQRFDHCACPSILHYYYYYYLSILQHNYSTSVYVRIARFLDSAAPSCAACVASCMIPVCLWEHAQEQQKVGQSFALELCFAPPPPPRLLSLQVRHDVTYSDDGAFLQTDFPLS